MSHAEVILVEDSATDAELTLRAFRENRLLHEVLHLEDGQEALDYFFRQGRWQDRPDEGAPKVILLDLKLPRVSGVELLERLKGSRRTRDIPVVVLTSSREEPDIQRCYELGANSYIVKPVRFEDFTRKVADLGMYWLMTNTPLTPGGER